MVVITVSLNDFVEGFSVSISNICSYCFVFGYVVVDLVLDLGMDFKAIATIKSQSRAVSVPNSAVQYLTVNRRHFALSFHGLRNDALTSLSVTTSTQSTRFHSVSLFFLDHCGYFEYVSMGAYSCIKIFTHV